MDGKYDYLDFDLEMPIGNEEEIFSLQMMLFFDYKLHVRWLI